MYGINIWTGYGNITQPPSWWESEDGHIKVLRVTIACNYLAPVANGERETRTDFVDIEFHGRLAERIHSVAEVGDTLVVSGRLQLKSWETSSGQKRSKYVVQGSNANVFIPKQGPNGHRQAHSYQE